MNEPQDVTVSVLVPSYNPGPYLAEALASALAELGPADEIVVQDACSTDGSRDLLDELAASDSRVRPVFEKDGGQSDALNRALGRAVGDWIVWLNADDVLSPGALDAVRTAVAEHPDVDVVTGDHRLIRANGETIDDFHGRPIELTTLLRRSTCASFSGSVAIRSEFLRDLGGFDDTLHATMDYELQFRIAEAQPRQVAVRAQIGALRLHDGSKTATLWRTFITEAHGLRMRYANSPRERLLGVVGTGEQAASFVVFGLRQTRGYRILRSKISGIGSGHSSDG
ncbi:glycosyltransferase [Gordonia sp. PDNC005]|uniref:glycosyltransferase n=1 Tax=unclassified Gordonia (in: high G+C Gram-positive bacteria) TaxID=2657482 RepID=UPI001963CE5C|nr:glycosyltransferase [Gordonia sp. PDNC005]QRY61677.1 glycosyltransferase [Gordonia sp. PDNC005]